MIGLKTVFNYIKFANELINKIFFMFNGIKKYVVRIVCVIMLLLVQFDVCAPLIDANLAMVETMEQPTLPSDNNEESGGEETYYFMSGRAQLPNSRFLPCTIVYMYRIAMLLWSIGQQAGTSQRIHSHHHSSPHNH